MTLDSHFKDFLHAISPTREQIEAIQNAHTRLRERLMKDADLNALVEVAFLQGSYARETMLCADEHHHPDVDVAVVTRLPWREIQADQALRRFVPFVREHYHAQWRPQRRVIGIHDQELNVNLDLAIMAHLDPDGVGWKEARCLMLPDRDVQAWGETNPNGQIEFTRRKKGATSGHYQGVVRALKWWKRQPSMPHRPGSYPMEHLIGVCCPDGITSVAQGVVETLEHLVGTYGSGKPVLFNHGVRHDVLERVSEGEFTAFINQARRAARTARGAYEEGDLERSVNLWRDLFGDRFPGAAGKTVVAQGGRWG